MGAFWDAWDKAGQIKQQQALGQMQQMRGLAGMMQEARAMQDQEAVRGLMSDPNIPLAEKRTRLLGHVRDPIQANTIFHQLETERIAEEKIKKLGKSGVESPMGKLLQDRAAALASGNTEAVKAFDQAISKANQTEGAASQENMAKILDTRKRVMAGETVPPAELDHAKFIWQTMVTPRVGADGAIIRPDYDKSFNPWANFGLPQGQASLIPSAPAAGLIPQVQQSTSGERIVGVDQLPPAKVAELRAAMAASNTPQADISIAMPNQPGVRARGSLSLQPPAPTARPEGSPNILLEDRKKYNQIKDDGQGGSLGLTREGKWEQIPMPDGARTGLLKGQRWNEEKGAPEWLPNTPEYVKQADKHAKDWNTVQSGDTAAQIAKNKIAEIVDPKNKDAFENLFGGYNATVTQFFPGRTQDLRMKVDSLKTNLMTAGKEMLVNAGGTSIGQITEREWPILRDQIEKISPLLSEAEAKKALEEIQTQFTKIQKRLREAYSNEWKESQFYKEQKEQETPSPTLKPQRKWSVVR